MRMKSATSPARPAARKAAPARSNKGGATRGKARAAQVRSTSSSASKFSKAQAKAYAKAYKSKPAPKAKAVKKAAPRRVYKKSSGFRLPTINGPTADDIRNAIGNSNPIDGLYKNISEAIRRATGG